MAVNSRTPVVVFSLLMLAGCGGSDRPALAPASGIVKLDGVPVAGATVTYIPVESGRPGTGLTDAEGRYTIKTFEDAEGGIVGKHKVAVMKVSGPGADLLDGEGPAGPSGDESEEDDGSDGLSQLDAPGAPEAPETVYDVPKKYINHNESGLLITVPSGGSDTLNLDLNR